jgi:hypothetical protein
MPYVIMGTSSSQEDRVTRNIVQWLKPSLLPFLIISASFITYLAGNSYPLISPEVWIALCGIGLLALVVSSVTVNQWRGCYALVVAVLIALFLDKQFGDIAHINKFGLIGLILGVIVFALKLKEKFYLTMTAFFATWLVSTLVLLLWAEGSGAVHFVDNGRLVGSNAPPRIIHLILDAHIGIEGMPTNTDLGKAVKEQIVNFYHRYDFFLYGGAYSHYFRTWDAIPNALNFSAEPKQNAWVTRADNSSPFRIRNNNYFKALSQRHYYLNVVESDILDFCSDSDSNAALQGCTTYRSHALGAITRVHLPVSQKVILVCVGYLKSSHRFLALAPMYQSLQRKFTSHGVPLLSEAEDALWTPSSSFFGSMNTMEIMDGLWDEVLRVPPGNVLFAHLLLPHYPYLYNADCSPHSSIEDWKTGTNFGEFRSLRNGQNSTQLREEQYQLYFQQLQCLYARLDTLFLGMKRAGVFDDSIIIVHGDHGSRTFRHEPTPENVALLTEDDYTDAFSTLYAIKIPGKPGGYDSAVLPLEQLLAQSLQIPQELRLGTTGKLTPFVYLPSKEGGAFLEVAFPMFAHSGRQ